MRWLLVYALAAILVVGFYLWIDPTPTTMRDARDTQLVENIHSPVRVDNSVDDLRPLVKSVPLSRDAPKPAISGFDRRADRPTNERQRIKEGGQVLASLPEGKIVLNAPKNMKVSENRAVYANVGVNVPIETLRKYFRATDQSHESALRVSSQMVAVLTGPGFEIKSTTPEEQSVVEGFPTVWSWNVEAKQEGEQELEAILYVVIPAADKSSRQRIDSYVHKIGVSVKEQTWGEWIKARKDETDAVKAIVVTLVTAVTATLGWLSYRRRRKREGFGHADPVT